MLYDYLVAAAKNAPKSGVSQAGTFTPYAEIAERAGRIATGLIDRGIERGTPIGILMVNGPDLLTMTYAVFAAGAIPVPLSAHAPRNELAATARKAHVAAIIPALANLQSATNLAEDLGIGDDRVFVIGGEGSNSIEELLKSPLGQLPKLGPDDMAL